MRSHGWAGNAPSSDEEAIDRILDAADEIIAERGASMRIADVARDLGVTRQTVYRYFPGTDALLVATALRASDGFLDQLAAHARGVTDPVTAVVEGLTFTIEELSMDSQIKYLLSKRTRRGGMAASITSETARTFGRAMLHRYDIDWQQHGFGEDELDELAEFCIRVMHSFVIDDGDGPRDATDLRRFLTRWVGPAIVYPKIANALGGLALAAPAAPRKSKARRRAKAS